MDSPSLEERIHLLTNYSDQLTSKSTIDSSEYAYTQKYLGELYYYKKDFLRSAYHFSESHAVLLRKTGTFESIRADPEITVANDPLSFHSIYASEGPNGMLNRLKEMPEEWTLVQLTRRVDLPEVASFIRKAKESPKLKDFFITRFTCGKDLEMLEPIVERVGWPNDATCDLIQAFMDISAKLANKKGSRNHISKQRQEASLDIQRHCKDLGPMCFKEWIVLLLGKLYSKSLEEEILKLVDNRLEEASDKVSPRQRYLCQLLALGCCHLENAQLEVALYQVFEGDEALATRVLEVMIRIKENYEARLRVAKRHPVLLILDYHLDIIPWENIQILKRHPVSRVYSLHILHCLFKAHKDYIRDGIREIQENDVCFYIVNPDGDLPDLQEKIPKFLEKRFPSWGGIVGKKPSEQEIIEALTEPKYQTYIYCGHGSGSQYLSSEKIQKLRVNPIQFLFGCSSAGLKDQGGTYEMYGDVMEFALAKSGCTMGMLWSVTSQDTDRITMNLANKFFPGTPVDTETYEPLDSKAVKKEGEFLRVIPELRECVLSFFNGAALIVRGIPVKLVPTAKEAKKPEVNST